MGESLSVGAGTSGGGRRGLLVMAALTLALGACEYDRTGKLSKDDYDALLKRQPPPSATATRPAPPIPDLQPVLAAPAPVSPVEERLVSVSVTETVPLKDLLQELARKAGVDLELDPDIRGGVIFSARERPFREVIERIAELAGLRYTLKDGMLRVELDRMHYATYRLDALNMARESQSSVATSTDVFQVVGGGAAGHGNGSSSQVRMESKANVWSELATGIEQILTNTNPRRLERERPAAEAVPVAVVAPAAAVPAEPAVPPMPGMPGAAAPPTVPLGTVAPSAPAITTAPAAAPGPLLTSPTATLLPSTGPAAAPPAAADPSQMKGDAFFTVNRQAGLVSVYGTSRQQKLVKDYLDMVKARMSAQVLIEAKVVEVTLDDNFRAGINWRSLGTKGLQFAMPFGAALGTLPLTDPPFTTPTTAPSDFVTLGYRGGDVAGLIDFMKGFGTIRTLSSPRLTALNNQSAVLKVAENQVYFTLEVTTTLNEGVTLTTVESELHTVPVGLVMTVLPVIAEDGGSVTLSLRPTVTRIVDSVPDPAVAFQNVQGVESRVPVVEIREMDSVVNIPSGNVVVMGGLMQERTVVSEDGVPGLKDIPVAGNLFKARSDQTQLVELVILLQATVVNGSESVRPADKDLYRKFFNDPRPVAF